ncbi:MAG: hypothetical protein HYX26_07940 [Acidobacteriales bacterium]|nr:hypothetical protein [Terriglobales bacterium]
MNRLVLIAILFALLVPVTAFAQSERGVMVREAQIYIAPDVKSAKLGLVTRGREVGILDRSREYIKVLANVDARRDVTGWIIDKGVVRASTPNGDRILFGEAVDAENEASKRGGRKGADRDAMRLYYRCGEYFPKSDLAGEALWRSADIRWQLDRYDVSGRRSYRDPDPTMRPKIEDDLMNDIRKKFPNTKWAALAEFNKIENKLCGDWRGLPKCAEKESEYYEKYVQEYPASPKAAEALYESAWRQAALIELYRLNNDGAKSDQARRNALALAQRIMTNFAQQGDWAMRAQNLIFKLEQGVPMFGDATQ